MAQVPQPQVSRALSHRRVRAVPTVCPYHLRVRAHAVQRAMRAGVWRAAAQVQPRVPRAGAVPACRRAAAPPLPLWALPALPAPLRHTTAVCAWLQLPALPRPAAAGSARPPAATAAGGPHRPFKRRRQRQRQQRAQQAAARGDAAAATGAGGGSRGTKADFRAAAHSPRTANGLPGLLGARASDMLGAAHDRAGALHQRSPLLLRPPLRSATGLREPLLPGRLPQPGGAALRSVHPALPAPAHHLPARLPPALPPAQQIGRAHV